MTRIGTLQGTYLGIYQAKVCEYWTQKPAKVNCKFCSVGLNLGVDDADEKSVDEVLEVVRAARDESGITYVDFNTGHYDGDTYLDILEPYILRIKKELGLLIGVQTPPHRDLQALRPPARDRRQPGLVLLRDLRPQAVRGDLPGQARRVRPRLLPRGDPLLRDARRQGSRRRALGHQRRDHRRARAAGVVDQGDRLDHLGGRDPDRLRLPPPGRHRPRGLRRRRRPRTWSPSSAASTRRAWSRGCRSGARRTSTSRW